LPRPSLVKPIFVVGMIRSGTSLVSTILSANPAIAIAPETHFLDVWMQKFRHLDLQRADEFEEFVTAFSTSDDFRLLGIPWDAVRADLNTVDGGHTWGSTFAALLSAYAKEQHKARTGEKTPAHYRFTRLLLSWFPDSKVLFVIRDPRAVTASALRVPWSHAVTYLHALEWRTASSHFQEFAMHPNVHLVRYEDLISTSENTLRIISDFLEVEYHSDMLNRRDNPVAPKKNEDAWLVSHWNATAAPVYSDSLGRWRRELSCYQIRVIEALVGDHMKIYNYEIAETQMKWSDKATLLKEKTAVNAGRCLRLCRSPREAFLLMRGPFQPQDEMTAR
jgi:hypothetical protein